MKRPGRMAAEVLRHVGKRPATVLYPAVPVKMPEAYRGKLVFHAVKCVGCKLCQKDCPAGALTIEKVGEKRFQAVFLLDRCIYCAQCVDSCNKDAIEATAEYELATLDRSTLRVTYHAPPPPTPVAPPAGAPPATPPAAPGGGEPSGGSGAATGGAAPSAAGGAAASAAGGAAASAAAAGAPAPGSR